MQLDQAMLDRRSIRGFTDKPVAREVLEKIISLAIRAPSSVVTCNQVIGCRRLAASITPMATLARARSGHAMRRITSPWHGDGRPEERPP